MAAVDYFLKVGDLKGESEDAEFKEHIQIESFSFGETQSGTQGFGGGGGAGKVQMQDFHFVMKLNSASPFLFDACAQGEHFKKATLHCRKAGKGQQVFLIWEMEDVLVSSYQTGGSGGGDIVPIDQVSLSFGKISIDYKKQKKDGGMETVAKKSYDLKQSKAA